MNFALEARCSLAMSRVLLSINPQESLKKLTEARSLAIEEGFSGGGMSALIGSEPILSESFMAGLVGHQSQLFEIQKSQIARWSGNWTRSSCGNFESRPYVVPFGNQYMAKVDVSHRHGDVESIDGDIYSLLEPAIRGASDLELDFHSNTQTDRPRHHE